MKHPRFIVYTEAVEYDEDGKRIRSTSSSCQTDTVESLPDAARIAVSIGNGYKQWLDAKKN